MKKKLLILLFVSSLFSLAACGVPSEDYNNLQEKYDTLQSKYDALTAEKETLVLCEYDSSIVEARVLEDDIITIYGLSAGTVSYQSTMGGKITVPSILVEHIDQ